jgi:4-amino-4-deoxy-L-arabinose transferase-like glycosyltransferase
LNIKLVTKPNWLLLILSVLLFIMVFLPWWTFFGDSEYGLHNGGILTLIIAITGIELSFLEFPNPKYRSYAIIGVGILALIGALIALKDLGDGVGMGFGMIIALILSIALIAVGFLDYRGIDLWAKMKASSSKPPAPPPPPPSNPPPAQK